MQPWLKDALSGPKGFERQFKSYVGKKEYEEIKDTPLGVIRRGEFLSLIKYSFNRQEES